MVGNFGFRPQWPLGERRAVGAGRNSSNRVVVSRIIAAMPIIWSESLVKGTIVNSTEIRAPSFRTAGTDRTWPSP
jgi:hypothetical protein